MRKILDTYPAVAAHMPGLSTWRALPTAYIEFLDPFLFLNHHGPEQFKPNNQGLPFGPHPHRGFETLTYILDGELIHQDTTGYKSKIDKGGVQWMTAGSGLLHSETSSEDFKREGGNMELIQLWLNLPSKLKMTPPSYKGLQRDELVHFNSEKGVDFHLISGTMLGYEGPMDSITDLTMCWIEMEEQKQVQIEVPADHQILFYVINGQLEVNQTEVKTRALVQFEIGPGNITISTTEMSRILFGHGLPTNEPIVAHGPFVMNTETEIQEAFDDFQNGKLGVWPN